MVGSSIQSICAITTQIESSICKLVEQKLVLLSVSNHIMFEETVSKSNFILTNISVK